LGERRRAAVCSRRSGKVKSFSSAIFMVQFCPVREKEIESMNTSSNATVMSNREFYRQRESVVLHRIPGVYELINSNADQRSILEKKYPDAGFALFLVSNLFFHDRELTNIHMSAYTDLLNGEKMADIRFHYELEMKRYTERHLWDD
jgi:hypothetical protein